MSHRAARPFIREGVLRPLCEAFPVSPIPMRSNAFFGFRWPRTVVQATWAAICFGMLGPGPATARTVPLPPFTVPPDSVARVAQRLPLLAGGYALSYGTLYTALAASWYTGEKVPLHWFNDLPEWQQLDKCGRFWGAFQESRGALDLLRWAGLSEKQAIWYGSFVGLALQSPVEYFDGRDPQYGAFVSDLGANLPGSLGVLG